MVELSLADDNLILSVLGSDKLWALRSTLEIPCSHISDVRADPEVARGWWHGLKLMGTGVPGVITAGTFYQHGELVFWDVHDPDNTIVISLRDERYKKLIVEVADPASAIALIRSAISI